MSIFDQLIEYRKKLNIKQKEIAKHLNIDKTTMSRYENKSRKISAEDQDKYAEFLGIKLQLVLSEPSLPKELADKYPGMMGKYKTGN